ncbi:SEC-C metal-binding domain-containing protein [Marinobacter sp.]|uniref:SEC-C metal-binding domain-containing protein n=1 Tax=Marinobacter sp. TaxID=50741 RepID=UPI003A95150C
MEYMDDIQFAFSVSDKLGKLYRDAKTFSDQVPALTLTHLRGLAYAVCDMLDRDTSDNVFLAKRIKNLESTGVLKASGIHQLRTLLKHGNIAAHPEAFNHETHDFGAMAAEGLAAAREVLGQLLVLRHEPIPSYTIATVEDSGLRDLCYQAMVLDDIDAIHQVGKYFKAQADQLSDGKSGIFTPDGYSLDAGSKIAQAMFWFKKGADLFHPDCMYQYGAYHFFSHGVDEDLLGRARWYISHASGAGNADAMVLVAHCSLEGERGFSQDEAYARELYEKAAEQNHPEALAQLGAFYALGTVCEVDLEAAARCTIRAAEVGFPQGQYNLSTLYLHGKGVELDEGKALKWLEAAAGQDYPEAIFDLATLIHKGHLPERNLREASDLYHQLARFSRYRALGALGLAKVTLELEDNLGGWLNAATYAHACYEAIAKEGDPDQLMKDCLSVAKLAIGKVRSNLEKHGPDPEKGGGDLFTCMLFDKDGLPVADRDSRMRDFSNLPLTLGSETPDEKEKAVQLVMEMACISAPPHSRLPTPAFFSLPPQAAGLTVKRKAPCPCGSGKKFKNCCGV